MNSAIPKNAPQLLANLFEDLVTALSNLCFFRVSIIIGIDLFLLPFAAF